MILYDKNLGRYCIWAKSAHGCDLCPERSIRFLGEKCLKKALHKNFLKTKVVTNHNTQLLVQRLFRSPKGCGLCPEGIIRFFLAKSALKMRCTKFFFQIGVVKNQNLQLLCYVIFFDILHHYGVIAASQICSVEKVLFRLTEQIFFFSPSSWNLIKYLFILFAYFYCMFYSFII